MEAIEEIDTEETKAAYAHFDQDSNGFIDREELRVTLEQCTGQAVTMASTIKVLKDCDSRIY